MASGGERPGLVIGQRSIAEIVVVYHNKLPFGKKSPQTMLPTAS